LRRMGAFGTRFISGADAGIAPSKAHGGYAEAVIELSQVTGTVPALVATSSGAAAAIGSGRLRGVSGAGMSPTYSWSAAT
jgi:hypothetical protein